MPTYPIWLTIFAILPSILFLFWRKDLVKKYKKVLIFSLVGTVVFSYPWDIIALNQRIWYFKPFDLFGVYIAGLPLEEWIFILGFTFLFAMTTIVLWDRNHK